jgi:hypothetical protein
VGYDIELISLKLPAGTKFPVEPAAAAKTVSMSAATLDAGAVRDALLAIPGCKPGPEDSVDYLGSGLSYARMRIKPQAVHIENNCGAKDLLKIQAGLEKAIGPVLIRDLQSGELHSADSFAQWWAKPL